MRFVGLFLVVLLFFVGAASAAPSVESDGVSGVGTDFLELNASVSSFSGDSVDVGVEYREASSGSDWARSSLETFTSTGTFEVGAEGLQESTEYELRAYAEDEDGSDTGAVLEANTTMLKTISSEEGSLEADGVVLEPLDLGKGNVGVDFLNFRGDVSGLGGVVDVADVDVNVSYRPEGSTEWSSVQADVITEDKVISERVDGLEPASTYEYRVETREQISAVEKVNTTMLKTVPSSSLTLEGEPVGVCDDRGLRDECISEDEHDVGGTTIDIDSRFEARETVLFQAFSGTGTLNITNSTAISGVWEGSFNISATGETRIESGAEFRPSDGGRIVIGR